MTKVSERAVMCGPIAERMSCCSTEPGAKRATCDWLEGDLEDIPAERLPASAISTPAPLAGSVHDCWPTAPVPDASWLVPKLGAGVARFVISAPSASARAMADCRQPALATALDVEVRSRKRLTNCARPRNGVGTKAVDPVVAPRNLRSGKLVVPPFLSWRSTGVRT